jgi:hypothetical protein
MVFDNFDIDYGYASLAASYRTLPVKLEICGTSTVYAGFKG